MRKSIRQCLAVIGWLILVAAIFYTLWEQWDLLMNSGVGLTLTFIALVSAVMLLIGIFSFEEKIDEKGVKKE